MADPERLNAALTALTLPADPSPEDFQLAWWAWTDGSPHRALPVGWRAQLAELIEYGLTRDDMAACVNIAMENPEVSRVRKFAYALGVARRYAKTRRHQQQLGVPVVDADPDLAALGPYIRTPGHVHRPRCRTLERANPWNARAVSSIVPFKPCRVCL